MKYNADWDVNALDQFTEVATALGYHISVMKPIQYNLEMNAAGFNGDFFLFEGMDAETAIAKYRFDMPPDDWESLCTIAASLTAACRKAAGISRTMCDSFGLRTTVSCSASVFGLEPTAKPMLGMYVQHPCIRFLTNAKRASRDFYDNVFKLEALVIIDTELADAVLSVCNDFDEAVLQGADDLCQWFLSRLHYEEMYAPADAPEDYRGRQA